VLSATSISKTFKPSWHPFRQGPSWPVQALREVSIELPAASITALAGPNGAGKTTLMRCLAGILVSDAGTVTLNGQLLEPHRADLRAQIGVVLADERSFHLRLTAKQNLLFFARLFQCAANEREQRVRDALELAHLADRAHTPYRELSTGMKRRLSFARSTLGKPRVLLLDEASSGLDPDARVLFLRALTEWVARESVAVLYAGHDLTELEQIADRVAVLRDGRLLTVSRWDEASEALQTAFPAAMAAT
jgi:ABC-type multidrug transport system ATPase subunit